MWVSWEMGWGTFGMRLDIDQWLNVGVGGAVRGRFCPLNDIGSIRNIFWLLRMKKGKGQCS